MNKDSYYAALDLGSNSFHLLLVQQRDKDILAIDRLKYMVRLGEGLDAQGFLSDSCMARALDALSQIEQRLKNIPRSHIRVVGTNTLRIAKNSAQFLTQAEKTLKCNIEIISGQEEARLIYCGVAHHNPLKARNLIIDIGGGSTEVIAASSTQADILHSLPIGSANMTARYFNKGKITRSAIKKACAKVGKAIEPYLQDYLQYGFEQVFLSSGTAKAIAKILNTQQEQHPLITKEALNQLVETLLDIEKIEKIANKLPIESARAEGFIGGVCVLKALFDLLSIHTAHISQAALREGVIIDLIGGANHHHDICARTVAALQQRFQVDGEQAKRVRDLAVHIARHMAIDAPPRFQELLIFASELHEVGRSLSFAKYQHHSAYILEHADMSGFSHIMQKILSIIVRNQRKKPNLALIEALPEQYQEFTYKYMLALRLAVVIMRGRLPIKPQDFPRALWRENTLTLLFAPDFLNAHPLTLSDLQDEQHYWQETQRFQLIF